MYVPLDKYRQLFITAIVIQACICVVGYIGNIITCIVIVSNKSMLTTTNIYLFNLAVTDIIMLTAGLMYFTKRIWYMSENQLHYGLTRYCFVVSWTVHTALSVSIMTLIAFTIERYLAICHPFFARRILSKSRAVKVNLVIWIIGIVFGYFITSYHHVFVLKTIKGEYRKALCVWNNGSPYVLETEALVFFAMPLIILLVLYILIGRTLLLSSRIRKNQGTDQNVEISSAQRDEDIKNRKIFKMLMTVVVVFFISWAPFHIGKLLRVYVSTLLPNWALANSRDGQSILLVIHSIAYFVSSAVNPIIYNAMSNKFRDAFKEVLIKYWYILRCKPRAKSKDLNTSSLREAVTTV